MPRFFTHYWSNATWRENRDQAGQVLEYLGGNQFRKRGVKSGDSVYVVTNLKGSLFLCAKMVIRFSRTREEAAKLRGALVDNAQDHLFSRQGTPMQFDIRVHAVVVRRLRFVGFDRLKPLKLLSGGSLHPQTIRGVRELAGRSAVLLDCYLPALLKTANPKRTPPIKIMRSRVTERLRSQKNRDEMLGHGLLRGTDDVEWGTRPFPLNRRLPGSFGTGKKK